MAQGVSVSRFLLLGAVIWLGALLLIRVGGAAIFSTGAPWLAVLFAATIPASWISTLICLPLGGATAAKAVPAVAIMSIAALLLDGIAFTWFPSAYGSEPTVVRLGAAWLLWAVGVFLAVAFWVARNRGAHIGT